MAKMTWADRAQEEFKACGLHGWHDLEYVFFRAEIFFIDRDFKSGRDWYNRGVVELERRMGLLRGEDVRGPEVSEALMLNEIYGIALVGSVDDLRFFAAPSDLKVDNVTVTKNKKSGPVVSLELPGIPRRRGRPVTGQALSVAERQKRYREKQSKLNEEKVVSASESFRSETDAELLYWLSTSGPVLQEKAWIELGRRKGWKLP